MALSVVSVAALREPKPEPISLLPARAVWDLALRTQLSVPPAFDKQHFYLGIDGDRLTAYRLVEGDQQWMVSAKPLMQPAVGDGLVFTAEPDAIIARHATNGETAWTATLTDTLSVPPVWDIGWLVVSTTHGSIIAFRAKDGQLIWRRDLKSPAHALPALAADRVYVPTEDGRVVALRVDTGAPVWERRLGGPASDILALSDRLYMGSKDNFMYCLMSNNGSIDWRWRTGGDVIGLPAVVDRRIYFVSLDNVLRGLDRISGVQQWMRALPIRPVWGPVHVVDKLLVAGQSSIIQAYNPKDGSPSGNYDPGAEVAAPPHIVADPIRQLPTIIVVTRDLAKGAAVKRVSRQLDPMTTILTDPLPNVISMAPAKTPERK